MTSKLTGYPARPGTEFDNRENTGYPALDACSAKPETKLEIRTTSKTSKLTGYPARPDTEFYNREDTGYPALDILLAAFLAKPET